ncbi:MAG: hypothetical protein R3A52_01915 [Polyangiales bacterium]
MARYLGVEVTEQHLRGALLRTAYKQLVIEAVYTVAREPGAEGITRAAMSLNGQVQATLAATSPGRPAELDGVYAALPGTDVSLRRVSLPKAVYRRGDKALVAELEGAVPFDLDLAMVDAQVVRAGDPVELLAAAVMRDRAEGFLGALKAGGLDPRELGVASVALGELAAEIPALRAPGPMVVIYATEQRAEVVVLRDGVVHFARTLANLSTYESQERGVRQTLAAWQAQGGDPPSNVWLCGDETNLIYGAVLSATGLAQESVAWMPGGMIQHAANVEESAFAHYPLAVALAVRGLGRAKRLDFRKGPLAVAGSAQVLRERAPYLIAAASSVVLFWGIATYARYQGLVQERNRLQTTLAAVTQEVFHESVDDPDRAMALARGEGGDDVVDPLPGADAYDVVGVLSTRITPDVRHDVEQLDVRGEHVQIQGVVDSLADRDKVVEALQAWPCFTNVRPGRVTTSPDNRQKYTLDIDFRCPDPQRDRARPGEGNSGSSGSSNTEERRGGGS